MRVNGWLVLSLMAMLTLLKRWPTTPRGFLFEGAATAGSRSSLTPPLPLSSNILVAARGASLSVVLSFITHTTPTGASVLAVILVSRLTNCLVLGLLISCHHGGEYEVLRCGEL